MELKRFIENIFIINVFIKNISMYNIFSLAYLLLSMIRKKYEMYDKQLRTLTNICYYFFTIKNLSDLITEFLRLNKVKTSIQKMYQQKV